MAAKSEQLSESDRIKEVMRLLKVAIEDCRRFLAEAEESVRQSHQENEAVDP